MVNMRLPGSSDIREEAQHAVAYISTFPPRACGIATFTRDLSAAVADCSPSLRTWVLAIDDTGCPPDYRPPVRGIIDQYNPESWGNAARRLNASPVDVVSIQHEFGIDGRFDPAGGYTNYLTGFLARIRKPVIATLHTVLPRPRPELRAAIQALAARSTVVVSMVDLAARILEEEYGLDPTMMHTIPHGVPMITPTPPEQAKRSLRLEGRTVLTTFGLLSCGKGIEQVLRILPEIVGRHPSVLYLVIGETHPEVRRREGEQYRAMLAEWTRRLGMEEHVRFVNLYLPQPQLIRYLQATDIYLTPYTGAAQITSGTLAYALGCGKAVVSTPYLYATEALALGRGLLADFNSPPSLARCILQFLEEPNVRAECERKALAYGRKMQWPAVGRRYADLFTRVIEATGREKRARELASPAVLAGSPPAVSVRCSILPDGTCRFGTPNH
ncbi:MAG TPA: glycosyltransferase family 4 protein [Chloroflexota bacterium]|nr:glycosyltransferase family 4 protein [Chloroflexota bacterium]